MFPVIPKRAVFDGRMKIFLRAGEEQILLRFATQHSVRKTVLPLLAKMKEMRFFGSGSKKRGLK